jgi:hypothetical protein
MKLKYFFVCILAAASLTVSPEIVLAHGGGGGHGFGGFSGTRGSFSGRGDHGRFGDRGFRGRDRDFRGRRFRDFDGAFSISDSMGSDIRIITSTTTHITIRTPISNYGSY